jgi:translation elongation factor EF-1alpha
VEEGKLIGKITHYFSKIGVAVIELSDNLRIGDKIRIVGKDADFIQEVDSMEADHQKIQEAKAGDKVGLKVVGKAREGCKVYKL